MLVASTAFVLGFLHGLGADHLMAVAALSVGEGVSPASGSGRAFRVAVQFACGHVVLLATGAAAALALGYEWPARLEQAGELVAGLLLVGLGAWGLWAVTTGRVYFHSHRADDPGKSAWHWHVGRSHRHAGSGRHPHLPLVLGALFAISGLRALTGLAPIGGNAIASPLHLLALILLFALGIVSSMTLFGVVLARVLSSRAVTLLGRAAAFVTAAASFALGLYWLASA